MTTVHYCFSQIMIYMSLDTKKKDSTPTRPAEWAQCEELGIDPALGAYHGPARTVDE